MERQAGRSWASCARCEGKGEVLEGDEKSTPGNTGTRRWEELTDRANLIAVLFEDSSHQYGGQILPQQKDDSLPKAQVISSLLLGRREGKGGCEQTPTRESVGTEDQHQVSLSLFSLFKKKFLFYVY